VKKRAIEKKQEKKNLSSAKVIDEDIFKTIEKKKPNNSWI
jgi:ribosomal protein S25